jgi:hypothetical protein
MPALMHQYNPGDPVYVRSAAPTWWPGVVASVDDSKIVVTLNAPLPTGSQWAGQNLPYGGNTPVDKTIVWIASEVVSQGHGSGCHIKPRP